MTLKPKLPREVAEAIREAGKNAAGMECLHDIPYMIRCVETELPDSIWFGTIVKFYRQKKENKVAYFQAIANGYEVEVTPEDKVREMFAESWSKENTSSTPNQPWWEGRRMAIIDVLDALEIKVKGVNDLAKA